MLLSLVLFDLICLLYFYCCVFVQVVIEHAVRVGITPHLSAETPGYLPIHCLLQLLKDERFRDTAVNSRCVCGCQRKTKDRADGLREKSAHCPRRDSNLYLWDTRPSCFRLHHDGRHASRQSKQTLQTLTRQLDRETIMHETLQLLSAGPRRQASARTSAESDEACQRKTKDRADGMRKKCPLPSTGFEPVSLGYAPIVLPIAPRRQARLPSVETNTSDTHPSARS